MAHAPEWGRALFGTIELVVCVTSSNSILTFYGQFMYMYTEFCIMGISLTK